MVDRATSNESGEDGQDMTSGALQVSQTFVSTRL